MRGVSKDDWLDIVTGNFKYAVQNPPSHIMYGTPSIYTNVYMLETRFLEAHCNELLEKLKPESEKNNPIRFDFSCESYYDRDFHTTKLYHTHIGLDHRWLSPEDDKMLTYVRYALFPSDASIASIRWYIHNRLCEYDTHITNVNVDFVINDSIKLGLLSAGGFVFLDKNKSKLHKAIHEQSELRNDVEDLFS